MKTKKIKMMRTSYIGLLIFISLILTFNLANAQKFTIEQTLSDGAQRTTIAFDALAFFTGSLGADSFFPPGKVADFWGFQYLRDNDPSEMGHNTDFLTKASLNMFTTLTTEQRNQLIILAKKQVDAINQYGYDRFVLMKAFRRLLEGNAPIGKPELNKNEVKKFSAGLYLLDGKISYERAVVMGGILKTLTLDQRSYLDVMVGKGMLTWPTVGEPEELKKLSHDEKVNVMTYSGDLFSWYAGSVESDVYFCPERQGTYFGSFYMKDAPAVGNPNYTIGSNITADYGNNLLKALSTSQSKLITGLVDIQKPFLLDIVDRRRDVSLLLRKFITGEIPDSITVMNFMEIYGELDGEIIYNFANNFAQVYKSLSAEQRTTLYNYRKEILGDYSPIGAYLYATPIDIPESINTDFLFSGTTKVNYDSMLPVGFELSQNYPNPFNPTTKISFSLPSSQNVSLKVYDVLGNEVAKLVNEKKSPGIYEVSFDASRLTSGVYFYSLRAGNYVQTKKLVLVK